MVKIKFFLWRNDTIKGGLGDDIIEIGEGNDTIYGDDEITSGEKINSYLKVSLADTIEDFEINNDKIIIELNDQDQGIELEGIETNSVKIKKISQNSQENTITLNSAAGIITASTLALATTEVMGLTTFTDVISNQNIDGNDDILDFSKITDSLVIDLDLKSFEQLSSGLQFSFDGYENIIGGSDIDQISRVVSSEDIIGIVGGKGNDQITGLNQDIVRYDLE